MCLDHGRRSVICSAKAVVGKGRQHMAFSGYCIAVAALRDPVELPFEGLQLFNLVPDRAQLILGDVRGRLATLIGVMMKFDELQDRLDRKAKLSRVFDEGQGLKLRSAIAALVP